MKKSRIRKVIALLLTVICSIPISTVKAESVVLDVPIAQDESIALDVPIAQDEPVAIDVNYYYGDIGIVWLRDLDRSPLTPAEAFAGNYTLEIDYLTYETAASINALATDYSKYTYFINLAENIGTGAAAAYLCSIAGIGTISSVIVGALVSTTWTIIKTYDDYQFSQTLHRMDASSFMKVMYFQSSETGVTKGYYVYASNPPYKVEGIENKHGNWRIDTFSVLYGI
mgnify:CR=1 FL=1